MSPSRGLMLTSLFEGNKFYPNYTKDSEIVLIESTGTLRLELRSK